MSKSNSTPSSSTSAGQAVPTYRIGDLIWCQETRNNKLWWPAMVTYDPHLGIFYRLTKQHKSVQYHVQYFGISAIRGWVGIKSCVQFRDYNDKLFLKKGLSIKVKAEYEVAIQEVREAASLDYKQRKLKFIFSFGPSRRKKGNTSRDTVSVPMKVESQEEHPNNQSVKQEIKEVKTARRRPSTISGSGNAEAISDVVKTKPPVALRLRDKKQGVAQTSKTNPEGGASSPPPCLHSQHYTRRSTRRRQSDSSSMECAQCMEYINNSEGIGLTCNSNPEVVDVPDMEGNLNPILMYVQKEYSDATNSGRSRTTVPPTLNRSPLTKGMPTKNVSTNHLSSRPKRSSLLAKTSEKDVKSGSGLSPPSPTSTGPSTLSGNISSESGYETGKNVKSMLLGHRRKRRKVIDSTSSSVPAPSPLMQVHSKQPNDIEKGVLTTTAGKRKRIKSTSNLPDASPSEADVDETGQAHVGCGEAVLPVKRICKVNSLQTTGGNGKSNSTIKKDLTLDSSSSTTAENGTSANDSCSEISTTSLASSLLTPPTSSSEESPSMDLECDADAPAGNNGQGLFSSSRESSKKIRHDSSRVDSKLSVCSICDCEDTDLLACTGHCMNLFHLDCLGLMREPSFKFVCDECLVSLGNCFVCGESQGDVKKCCRPKCGKLYHLNCIKDNELFQFGKSSSSFTCPLHVCAKCTSIGISTINSSSLLQCVKCPIAFHKPDCLVAGCEIINQTQMLCYQHVKITKSVKLYSHINLNTCLECGSLGSLYCCDVCSAAYHMECLDEDARPASDTNHWKCPSCAVHDLPTYGSLVIIKFGVWRWWPSEVVLPEDIPDNILPKKPGDCMFVVRFCGSRDFCWTYHGRVLPFMGGSEIDGLRGFRKGRTPENYQRACEEAKEIYKTRRMALEAKEAARQNSKFYTKIKTNKYLVPRPPLDLESLDFLPCQCTPENPCRDDSTCVNRAIHIECNPKTCPVGDLCLNQRMQKCQNARTETFFTGNRGWGLKAATDLSVGDFVIEYVGEVLDTDMCKERLTKAHAQSTNNFYMLTLDAGLVIDASQKSNHARFINHSCGPNCETQKWRVKGEPRIGIFARQNIPVGTELTFDYHLDSLGNEKKKCHCGSKNCSGFLGLRSSKIAPEEELKMKSKAKKRKRKPRQLPKKDTEEEEIGEDMHEDDCFICKDGGELLLCDHKSCSKAYHLECLNRKVIPPKSQKWECPWHFCTKCQKTAFAFCCMCPVSFCTKHLKKDELFLLPGSNDYICQDCSEEDKPQCLDETEEKLDELSSSEGGGSETIESDVLVNSSRKPRNKEQTKKGNKVNKPRKRVQSSLESDVPSGASQNEVLQSPGSDKTTKSHSTSLNSDHTDANSVRSDSNKSPNSKLADSRNSSVGTIQQETHTLPAPRYPNTSDSQIRSPPSNPLSVNESQTGLGPLPATISSSYNERRAYESHRSPSAFRTCLTRTPLFQPPQVQSPTMAQNYSSPTSESQSAKVPDNNYIDFGSSFPRTPAAGFQQPQQLPASNNLINPVWFMPRNGLMNGLDPGASGFSYPSYPSALINHGTLGFPYPGYFSEPMSNFESFNFGIPPLPPTSTTAPTSASFPSVFPPSQNGFLAWKYC